MGRERSHGGRYSDFVGDLLLPSVPKKYKKTLKELPNDCPVIARKKSLVGLRGEVLSGNAKRSNVCMVDCSSLTEVVVWQVPQWGKAGIALRYSRAWRDTRIEDHRGLDSKSYKQQCSLHVPFEAGLALPAALATGIHSYCGIAKSVSVVPRVEWQQSTDSSGGTSAFSFRPQF